jgi:hypothetical protein
MSTTDQAIIAAYLQLRIPADRIAAFLAHRQAFLNLIAKRQLLTQRDDDLIWRLLQLRKCGKLPSLRKGGK